MNRKLTCLMLSFFMTTQLFASEDFYFWREQKRTLSSAKVAKAAITAMAALIVVAIIVAIYESQNKPDDSKPGCPGSSGSKVVLPKDLPDIYPNLQRNKITNHGKNAKFDPKQAAKIINRATQGQQ